jgi:hypothetical protein
MTDENLFLILDGLGPGKNIDSKFMRMNESYVDKAVCSLDHMLSCKIVYQLLLIIRCNDPVLRPAESICELFEKKLAGLAATNTEVDRWIRNFTSVYDDMTVETFIGMLKIIEIVSIGK